MNGETGNDASAGQEWERELAALDEALRIGDASSSEMATISASAGVELEGAAACLRLLERVWPRNKRSRARRSDETNTPTQLGVIGDYELLDQLGAGGMGTVYMARQRGTERIVALKMIRRQWIENLDESRRHDAIEQFYREIKAAARLKHPHIVQVFHMGDVDGQSFFAMEYVEGKSLSEQLKQQGPLGNRQAAQCLFEVADAIHHAHRHGILHRDIKPHNLLQDESQGTTKVADFGLAELRSDAAGSANAATSPSSRVAGTVAYMAPEVLGGSGGATISSDVYSLGATLYELLTGKQPFPADNAAAIRNRIMTQNATPPRQLNASIAVQLEAVCMRCLAKDPALRYGSAGEIADDLAEYLNAPKFAAHMAKLSKWVIAAAIAVLLINVSVYWLLRGPFFEPLIWLLIFCMYPPIFLMIAHIPVRKDRDNRQARAELWSIWLGKALAAACISIGLRIILAPDARLAIQMSYPMFAGLSGMACFAFGASFWRGFYLSAIGFWILGVLMMFRLDWAPLAYGIYSLAGMLVYGLYLQRLAREFR